MASLAFVTKEMRSIIKYGAIGLAGLFALIIAFQALFFLKELIFPSKPPPPKQEFGKLPRLFTTQVQNNIEYKVNTVDGTLPVLPDRMQVYKIEQFAPDLLALENAKRTLRSANFNSDPIKISNTIYQWTNSNGINVQYDIITRNFTVASNFRDNPNMASSITLPGPDVIKNNVRNFLNNFSANVDDVDFENSNVTYLELRDKELVGAANLGSARLARVDLRQNSIDDTQIVYASPTESNLSFVVAYPGGNATIVEGNYYHYRPLTEEKSDYPIKTADQALLDLQSGKAVIFNPTNKSTVDITDVQVKYYLDKNTKEYLEPIIVFSGIGFTAYVDAIAESSLQ